MDSKTSLILPDSYPTFLAEVKTRIQQSQIKAAISINQELIKLHWWIGREIVLRKMGQSSHREILQRHPIRLPWPQRIFQI